MKEKRNSRGRNRYRNDQKNEGRNNNQNNNNRNNNKHRHNKGRHGRYNSGNKRERISVESGFLVLIDQYMLANEQFTSKLSTLVDAEPAEKDALINEFGGHVVEIPPGRYRIDRDPYKMLIVVHPEGESTKDIKASEEEPTDAPIVFIDTRCVVMIDRELLDDYGLIEKYQSLWLSQQNKACRDLLRDNGGAVRYGFSRESDELLVEILGDKNTVILRPKGEVNSETQEAA